MNSAGFELLFRNSLSALAGAVLRISDGSSTAEASLDVEPVIVKVDAEGDEPGGVGVLLTATFKSREANFEWKRREVVLDGEVIDSDEEDMGRKVLGQTWTAEHTMVLVEED